MFIPVTSPIPRLCGRTGNKAKSHTLPSIHWYTSPPSSSDYTQFPLPYMEYGCHLTILYYYQRWYLHKFVLRTFHFQSHNRKLNYQQLKSCIFTRHSSAMFLWWYLWTVLYLQNGGTPLYIACQEGHLLIVERLIAAKADVNHQKKVPILHQGGRTSSCALRYLMM